MFNEYILNPVLSSIDKFRSNNAFCINRKFYTYGEFGQTISAVRHMIIDADFHNKNVGLVINDDLQTYASIFALWLEGYSYVPLHPAWPKERCLDIVQQVNLDLIVDSSISSRYDTAVLNTSVLSYGQSNLFVRNDINDDELAYILFTSGSTGQPKGVQITRRNISAFMDSFWKTGITINESDRCLQAFDLTFDVSVQSYLVPLTRGACCYTIPHGQIKYIYACGLIDECKITFGAMAPSMLRYMKPFFGGFDATSMKQCILTAEACPSDLLEEWFKCAPNVELFDFYGPTEATIYCTFYKLDRNKSNKTLNGIISIGKPMANVQAIIIDEKGNRVPKGEKGELCVAGEQVTVGYFNNPDKNAESFFIRDYEGRAVRFYHTGDLCYEDEQGDIMYSGRLDHQAKIQGFRVEMGEIEYHARCFLSNVNVVCMAYDNKEGLTEIAMFIESDKCSIDELREYLRSKMPSYMIPAQYIFQREFSLNGNGKIDKNILKKLIVL